MTRPQVIKLIKWVNDGKVTFDDLINLLGFDEPPYMKTPRQRLFAVNWGIDLTAELNEDVADV